MKPHLVSVWATVGKHESCEHDPVFSGSHNPTHNPLWWGICSFCGLVGKWQFESPEEKPQFDRPRFNALIVEFKHGK